MITMKQMTNRDNSQFPEHSTLHSGLRQKLCISCIGRGVVMSLAYLRVFMGWCLHRPAWLGRGI